MKDILLSLLDYRRAEWTEEVTKGEFTTVAMVALVLMLLASVTGLALFYWAYQVLSFLLVYTVCLFFWRHHA